MKERTGFTFYKSFKDSLSELPDEDKLLMYESICDYALDGKEPDLNGFAKSLFTLIEPTLKGERSRFFNGCKGGAPKGSLNNPNGRRGTNQELTENKPRTNQELTENKPIPIYDESWKMKDVNKETTNVVKKVKLSLPDRQKLFYESLISFIDTYGREMVRSFFDYWSEPNPSKTKMRFELQKTWDVSRRLKTWEGRSYGK